jgi:hypothetical protein
MNKSEKTTRNKKEDAGHSQRVKREEVDSSSAHLHAFDEDTAPVTGTRVWPSMDEHMSLLAEARSNEQRANIVLRLQQAYGNAYVQRLLNSGSLRAKLNVSSPGDKYEEEADRVSQKVINMAIPLKAANFQEQKDGAELSPISPLAASITSLVQRQGEEEEELQMKLAPDVQRQDEEEEELQAKSLVQRQGEEGEEKELVDEGRGHTPARPLAESSALPVQCQAANDSQVSDALESRIVASKGSGKPLTQETLAYMEPRFGADFSSVRVHTDSEAAGMNRALNAQAFTHGRDVYMGEGKYNPDSDTGKRLLAHELTHVVQQGGARAQARPQPTFGWSQRDAGTVQRNGGEAEFPKWRQIITDATVKTKMSEVWNQSLAKATPAGVYELGFWVQWDKVTNKCSVGPTKTGDKALNTPKPTGASIKLGAKPADKGNTYTVASFHTHPTTEYYPPGWERKVGRSLPDRAADNSDKVTGIVFDYMSAATGKIKSGHPKNSKTKIYRSGAERRPGTAD